VKPAKKRGYRPGKKREKHGMSHSPERYSWNSMVQRCCNENNPAYPRYGGRGITIHPEWVLSFSAFLSYMGPRPSAAHSLDRIDNDKGYEPGNVRWATAEVQNQNSTAAKLTHEIAARIRERHAAGESQRSIARSLGVTHQNVGFVVRGVTWKQAVPKVDEAKDKQVKADSPSGQKEGAA
jgi:hypothetical protein